MGRSRRAGTVASLGLAALLAPGAAPALAVPDCPGVVAPRPILTGQGVLESIIFDRKGRLIYSDGGKRAFLRIDARGAAPRILAGDIDAPGGIALDSDGALIAGYGDSVANGAIGALDPKAGLLRIDPETGAETPYATGLQMSNGVARGPDGTVYASNDVGLSLDRVLPNRTVELGWSQVPSGNGLALDSTGRYLFVNQTFRPAAIQRVDVRTAQASLYAQPPASDIAAGLDGMTVDAGDRLFVAANAGGEIWRVDTDRSICALARGLSQPSAVALAPAAATARGFSATSLYFVTFGGEVGEIPGVLAAATPHGAARLPGLGVTVAPFAPPALRHVRLRMRVRSVSSTGATRYLAGATVRIGRRTARTGTRGRASLRVFLRRGASLLRVTAPRHRQARVLVRAR
jgi:sugar lactone lactonase YvrE